jgi:hypothetical protein
MSKCLGVRFAAAAIPKLSHAIVAMNLLQMIILKSVIKDIATNVVCQWNLEKNNNTK